MVYWQRLGRSAPLPSSFIGRAAAACCEAGSLCSPLYSAARAALEISSSVAAHWTQWNRLAASDASNSPAAGFWARPSCGHVSSSLNLLFQTRRRTRQDACKDVVYDSSHRSQTRRPILASGFYKLSHVASGQPDDADPSDAATSSAFSENRRASKDPGDARCGGGGAKERAVR